MIRSIPANSSVDHLSLDNFMAYLQSTGWRRVEYHDDHTIVFVYDTDEGEPPFVVALPANEQFSNFTHRIAVAVRRLADVEEISPEDVIRKIESVGQDVIHLHLSLPHNDLPSLEITSRFLQGVRNLVVYGACMEREVRRYFEQPFRVGREQARHFQFAHTFRGSFGFTIESRIDGIQQLALWGGQNRPPVQRRVLERITRGFLFAKNAQQRHSAEEISQHFKQGLNANMCKAIVDMLEEIQDAQLVYSVRWSAHLRPSSDVSQITPILLDRETSYYLREAAEYLERTADADLEGDRTVEGPITNLHSEDQTARVVTVSSEGFGKVSFALESKEYAVACDAHRDGRTVIVKGQLVRQGRRGPLTLLRPCNFHLMQENQ
jgi:hypothetical protein